MERELALKYILSSKETKAHYNLPLFSNKEIDNLLQYFKIIDFHLITCNSLQKVSCFLEKNKCIIYDTGITEFFAFFNYYIENNENNQLFEGIILRLFAEGYFLIDEYNFSNYILKGYHYYEDKLLAKLNNDSYKYLAFQELFVIAHEFAHVNLRNNDFKATDMFSKEFDSMLIFLDIGEKIIKMPTKWIEFFKERFNDPNFTEEFICDSLAIRSLFYTLKIDADSIYIIAGAIIVAIFAQYIMFSVGCSVSYSNNFMSLLNRNKDDLSKVKFEYPSNLDELGTYLVYRYAYVRFCINTICQDFGISYDDMKEIDNYTSNISEQLGRLFILKNEGSTNILGLFYDYKTNSKFNINMPVTRRNVKEIFIDQAHRYNEWLKNIRSQL